MSKKEKQYKYLVAFLQEKTQLGGFKQTKLAEFVDRSPSYINSIIWDKKKKNQVDKDLITEIAVFFDISVNEMLETGKKLLEKPAEQKQDNSPNDPDILINQGLWLVKGIIEMTERQKDKEKEAVQGLTQKIEKQQGTIDLFKKIFQELDEGVTFFDKDHQFIYSSNRWGLLDGIGITQKMTLESIMLHTMHQIDNFEEVKTKLWEAYYKQKKKKIIIKLKSGEQFIFKVIPLHDEDKFAGILIINTPVLN